MFDSVLEPFFRHVHHQDGSTLRTRTPEGRRRLDMRLQYVDLNDFKVSVGGCSVLLVSLCSDGCITVLVRTD